MKANAFIFEEPLQKLSLFAQQTFRSHYLSTSLNKSEENRA